MKKTFIMILKRNYSSRSDEMEDQVIKLKEKNQI